MYIRDADILSEDLNEMHLMEAGLCHIAERRSRGFLQQQHSRTMHACGLMTLRNGVRACCMTAAARAAAACLSWPRGCLAGNADGEVDDYRHKHRLFRRASVGQC